MPSSKTTLPPTMQTQDSKRLAESGIDPERLERVYHRIETDIARGLYPGASIALARHGELLAKRHFGLARLATGDSEPQQADDNTLWLLYSQTKPIVSCAVWILLERGELCLHEPVAYYVPDFARHGKEDVTVHHILSHQGGFPSANVSEQAWQDHALMHREVCDFEPEWQAGSRVQYHGYAGHWVQAMLIEAICERDYREVITNEILTPLRLSNLHVGVAEQLHCRIAGNYEPGEQQDHKLLPDFNHREFFMAGVPGAGGFGSASDLAMFYQMLLGLGRLQETRILSPRMVQCAVSNHTGDRIDDFFGIPMHRGLGVHLRGRSPEIRGLAGIASPSTFGHGGVGTSYTWADPETGVSCTYLSNSRLPEPAHSRRLEQIMTMAHASVVEL